MNSIIIGVVMAVMLFVSVGAANAQDEDECMMGPSSWKELADDNPTEKIFVDAYNDALRQQEIKEYIDDNKDDLSVQDWQDDDMILCGIADNVVDKENELGKTFIGSELERNVKLAIMKNGVDTLDTFSKRHGLDW